MGLCRTSRQRRILGITSTGKVIPFICGAEGEEDDKKDDENGSSEGSENEGSSGDGSEGGPPKVYSQQDIDSLMKRMSGADSARVAAEKKVKEFEDASKSELDKAKSDLAEATAASKKLAEDLKASKIHNKFLASNKHTWHDAETALQLLDLSEVEVSEDGKVKGLEDAIEALAKAKPFLISGEGGKGDSEKSKKQSDSGAGGQASGKQPPANGSNDKRSQERAALLKKYPQLAR